MGKVTIANHIQSLLYKNGLLFRGKVVTKAQFCKLVPGKERGFFLIPDTFCLPGLHKGKKQTKTRGQAFKETD